jgi:hypothetical protein
VTVDESSAAPPESPTPPHAAQPATRAELALGRYRADLRRRRIWYYGAIAVVVVALAVTVIIAWSHGEAAHTTLKTATPAPSVTLQNPSNPPQQAWQNADHTAIGTPYWGGTVVTYSADSVRGRAAATGEVTWSYTRTDRTVCQAIQDQGVTIAIFELHGNCDQVIALDSATGERKWTRTLDKDGMPLNGHPTYAVTQYTIMLTTPTVIYALDPAGGLDRWTFHQAGCTISSAVFGTEGALISQTCAKPDCDGLKFCGAGKQLLLRDATAGRNDDDKHKDNPDQIKWNLIGSGLLPASADQLISAIDVTANRLDVLDVTKGSTLGKLSLQGTASGAITQIPTAHAELLWIGGVTYSVELTGADFFWATPTTAPPTVVPLPGMLEGTTDLHQSAVSVADTTGIVQLDPGTGRVRKTFPVAAPPTGSLAYPFGSGFVVSGSGTTVYR